MANIIVPNAARKAEAEYIMKSYGVDRRDPAMRDAAEVAAARTSEAIKKSENRRKYF